MPNSVRGRSAAATAWRPAGRLDPYNASASLLLVAYTGVAALLGPAALRGTYLAMLVCSLAGALLAWRGYKAVSALAVMAACATYPIAGLWSAAPTSSAFSEILWMILVPCLGSILVPLRFFVPAATAFLAVVSWLFYRNPEIPADVAMEAALGMALVTALSSVGAWQLERHRRGLLAEVAERRTAQDDLEQINTQLEERVERRAAELLGEVAERRRTEEQLLAANRELEGMHEQLVQLGKLAAVGELGAGIAHELNQPLSAIEFFADSLRRDPQRRIADCQEELAVVQEQGRRMARLVDNLRAFSRRSSIRLQRLQPLAALTDALTLMQAPLALASVTVVERHDGELPDVKGDPVLLQQVFVNLLSNSLQALERLPAGQPRTITVAVTHDGNGDGVRFTIEDSGPGIPAELESRVFEPFFTTRDDRGGTGLGLTLSARIVQRHDGELVYERNAAGGARFHWSLPLWTRPADTPRQPVAPLLGEETGRVLAVDDEQVVLFGLQRLLAAWGWEMTTAGSAAAALSAIDGGDFDVALVDLRMPEMGGLELIAELGRRAPATRIVAMSGYVSEQDRLSLTRLGVFRILPKPVPSEVLRSTLSDALAGRPAAEDEPTPEATYSSWLRSETPRGGWSHRTFSSPQDGERITSAEAREETEEKEER